MPDELLPEQLEKIQNFKWIDDNESADGPQPGSEFADSVLECAKVIAEYVIQNVCLKHYDENRLCVPIPLETHPLLKERFNAGWTELSRAHVFELIRGACIIEMELVQPNLEERLNGKLFCLEASAETKAQLLQFAEEAGLTLHSKVGVTNRRYKVIWTRLYDEPNLEDGEGQIVMEIGLESVEDADGENTSNSRILVE